MADKPKPKPDSYQDTMVKKVQKREQEKKTKK